MSEPKTSPAPPQPSPEPSTEVFAVHGVEPEVQAYAMAKYSRSALSMKESLKEINEQKAEKFLNTFYFQYGHRSIADLAHIALAVEKLSILAAIILVDEQRWDGQERSTRYQDFKKSGYHVPDFGANDAAGALYRDTIEFLFREYEVFSEGMWRCLADRTPKPAEMKQDAYERSLRARAFDISRYLLPLATNTSLGQIVNARTLETQVARLLSNPYAEVRRLGQRLKQAALQPAYNVNQEAWRGLVEEISTVNAELGERARETLLKEVRVAPTLVKYADAVPYEMETRRELRQAAAELMSGARIAMSLPVELVERHPLEVELAATLLYEHCRYPYKQVKQAVEGLSQARREEIIGLGTRHRSKHDELSRAFSAGPALCFDILMDVGGYRDLHRHRRCVQIAQDFSLAHGYDTPDDIVGAGLRPRYDDAMRRVAQAAAQLQAHEGAAAEAAAYLAPLAFRKRSLFKMDFAEAVYICELRTTPAGHFSYRNIAWQMYQAVARQYPALAPHFRVTDVRQPVDLLKR